MKLPSLRTSIIFVLFFSCFSANSSEVLAESGVLPFRFLKFGSSRHKTASFTRVEYWYSTKTAQKAVIVSPSGIAYFVRDLPDKGRLLSTEPLANLHADLAADGYVVMQNGSRGLLCKTPSYVADNNENSKWVDANSFSNECMDNDARLSITQETEVQDLAHQIAMAHRRFPGLPVCLMGVSDQGLVAARYLSKRSRPHINALITIGTPFAPAYMEIPYNFGVRSRKRETYSPSEVAAIDKYEKGLERFRSEISSHDKYHINIEGNPVAFVGLPWEVMVFNRTRYEAERELNPFPLVRHIRNYKGNILSVFGVRDEKVDTELEADVLKKVAAWNEKWKIMLVDGTHTLWGCGPDSCRINNSTFLGDIKRAIEASCQ